MISEDPLLSTRKAASALQCSQTLIVTVLHDDLYLKPELFIRLGDYIYGRVYYGNSEGDLKEDLNITAMDVDEDLNNADADDAIFLETLREDAESEKMRILNMSASFNFDADGSVKFVSKNLVVFCNQYIDICIIKREGCI